MSVGDFKSNFRKAEESDLCFTVASEQKIPNLGLECYTVSLQCPTKAELHFWTLESDMNVLDFYSQRNNAIENYNQYEILM